MAIPLVYRLPPYRVEMVFRALSETIDWGVAAYGIPEVWKLSRGRGVRVAILDTGIDDTHSDLVGTVLAARDFSRSNLGYRDQDGHGTHVSGIIAARQNGLGVAGICPDLNVAGGGLLVGKVLGDEGAGTDASIAAGIEWAAAEGAHLISMSLGSPTRSALLHDAVRSAVNAGVFVVCAAGNHGADNTVDYPGRFSETIAVAAVDRHGRVTQFSSRGAEVDIAAPGQDILSTYPGNRYAKLSGTSMAAPFVAGVIALMLAKHREQPGMTPIQSIADLRNYLARTATEAGSPGKDPAYGYGLVNPASMLGHSGLEEWPPWTGLRIELDIAGTPAVAVLAPREAKFTIEPFTVTAPELTESHAELRPVRHHSRSSHPRSSPPGP